MRILVIEDEEKICKALKKALERETYAVDTALDGDDGYAMATTESYDVMIIDRMLPGEYDGIGIVKEVRKAGIHTPILFLSALNDPSHKTEGLNAGADDYLGKPFSLDELLARVKALLRRPPSRQDEVLTAGDLSLDTLSLKVEREGQTIELTNKEFALLEYLLRNQGRPISKESIINHVWDFDADILPNNVEVHIKFLRNKIDKPFKDKLIHTVHGFGYKLEAK